MLQSQTTHNAHRVTKESEREYKDRSGFKKKKK